MIGVVKHASKIDLGEKSSTSMLSITPTVTEPFTAGRSAPRLLFDFGVMASLMKPIVLDQPVLDFGSGTGWVAEFCARMGLRTVAFDIHGDLQAYLENGAQADRRIDESLLSFAHGDGHAMPFESGAFGHSLCYDTLHHMHDYPKVFAEFFRVLQWGGARHLRGTGGTAQHFARNSRVCRSTEKARPKLDRAGCSARGNRSDRTECRLHGRFMHRADAAPAGFASLFHGGVVAVSGWRRAGALALDGSTRQSQLLGSRHFPYRQARAKVTASHAYRL